MEPRRGGRISQVRPRPPSSGRARPVKVRPGSPSPARIGHYRRIERRHGLPLAAKGLLAASIIVLGAFVLWAGSGAIGPFAASVVRSFGGFVASVGSAVGSTAPTEAASVTGAPSIVSPDDQYTNRDTVAVTVNVPSSIAGLEGYVLRLWVTLPDTPAAILKEVPVGPTAVQVISGVHLSQGRNDLQASIKGLAGDSDLSAVATWILDTSKPKVTIISPKDGSSVSKASATIKGKTQGLSTVRLTNDANGAVATVKAGKDGLWEAAIAIGRGTNTITITATDPAGNANTATLDLRRGSGKVTVVLTGTVYRFKASKLPRAASFTVTVTDPDGRRLAGATALFTVTVPGLQAIVSGEIRTDGSGVATFTANIPKGAMRGSGLASVLITTTDFGTATDRQVLTVE